MKRSLFFLMVLCLAATSALWAQSVGDFGSAQNGNWTSDTTWVLCVTEGTWEGATPPATGISPTEVNNVWIRSGHTVIFNSSSKKCKDLTIEAGGSLIANTAVSSPVYVAVYGSTLTVDGNYGGESDGLGLKPYGAVGATLTITGTGTCNISRIQPQNADQSLVFDMDCGINYSGSTVGSGSSALYPNSKDNCTFTINAGKTVTMAEAAYISLGSSGSSAGALSMTINVDGTLIASGPKSIINLNTAVDKTVNLNVGSTGIVTFNSYLRGGANNAGTVNINVASGGALNGTATGTFDISNANVGVAGSLVCAGTIDIGMKQIIGTGSVTLDAGATLMTAHPDGIEGSVIVSGTIALNTGANYTYNGTIAQVTGISLPATINDLTIDNVAGVTLSQATTVSGNLILTSGDLALNGKALAYPAVSGNGSISEMATLTNPAAVDVGNFGAVITSAADLGATVVKRGFSAQTLTGGNSIQRWYMITPTTNTGLNATLVFNYDESELNGLTETDLVLYSSADTGKTWTEQGGTLDGTNDQITLTGINAFSMWTAGGTSVTPAPAVFISEYIEGSSNNKALEIYNGTGADVDLSQFTIKAANNGTGWGCVGGIPDTRYVLPLTGTLAAGDVYVVYNSAADAAIVAVGDLGLAYNNTVNGGNGDNVPAFNGDDAIGLFYNDELIDVIGIPTADPGTNWPVAGTGATSEFTLVRKASVVKGNTDWAVSAGTNAEDSEWEVYPQNTFGYLGEHPTVIVKPAFTTCVVDSSSDKAAWGSINGNLSSGFKMTLDPAVDMYYLNFGPTTATNVAIKAGYYGFTIASHPDGFFEYWAGRGVADTSAAGTWQAEAWKIINGNLPTFYVASDGAGVLTLVDGLVKAIGQPDEFLRIEGTYLLGAYSYKGKMTAADDTESDTITVNITFEAPLELTTIAEIQDTTGTGNGDSKLKGQTVLTTGIVTAAKTGAYFIQDKTGPWNGVYVYDSGRTPVVGDSILIECTVSEYYNLTELGPVTKYEVIASGRTLPEPVLLSTANYKQEQWEGVLITVDNAECISTGSEWEVDDGSGVGRIDDLFYKFTPVMGYSYKVTGPVNYSFNNFMVTPRNADDILEYVPPVVLPLVEAATDGVLDLEWIFDPWTVANVNEAALTVVDLTGEAWASHVVEYTDSVEIGIAEVAKAEFSNYTISADIYLEALSGAGPQYKGLAVMADSNKYYRFVHLGSTDANNGQLILEGYDGSVVHIGQSWMPGTDFTALAAGWHNFKITKMGNSFWAYIDGTLLPGCPVREDAPFMAKGAPGIFKYNEGFGRVRFDNFTVTEPEAVSMAIADAIYDGDGDFKADLIGQYVTVEGIITTPNLSYNANATSGNYERCDYIMQDETGGLNLYSFNFRSVFALGDRVRATGKIDTYNGKNEVIADSANDIIVLSSGNPLPEPKEISLAELNSETFEGQLVVVRNLHPIKFSAWPVMDSTYGMNYSVYATDGGPDTVQVFLDRQTEVPLWEGLPYFNFDVIGIVSQYSTAKPPNNGYEIIPRFETDFSAHVPTAYETDLDESFETVFPPTGWFTFVTELDSGVVTAAWSQSDKKPVTGTYHAYMSNYASGSYCWLVTPPLDITGEKNVLSFVAFDEVNTTVGNYGSELVVLAGTTVDLFNTKWTEVKRITETECVGTRPVWTIDLPALSDTSWAYIAFMVRNFGDPANPDAGGDNWIVDDVKMTVKVGIKDILVPGKYALHQNYPNPFNPTTNIKLDLPKEADVTLKVYNIVGQEVATIKAGKMQAGYHNFIFDASRLASGIYFYRVEANGFTALKKMTILK